MENEIKRKRGRPLKEDANYKKDDYKEQQKAYRKEYYTKNKETVLGSMKQRVQCDICGCTVCKTNLIAHKKTNKCRKVLDKLVDTIFPELK